MKNRRAVLRKVATGYNGISYTQKYTIKYTVAAFVWTPSENGHIRNFPIAKKGHRKCWWCLSACVCVCVRHAMNVALFTNAANIMYVPIDGKGWIEKEKESRMVHTLELAQQ